MSEMESPMTPTVEGGNEGGNKGEGAPEGDGEDKSKGAGVESRTLVTPSAPKIRAVELTEDVGGGAGRGALADRRGNDGTGSFAPRPSLQSSHISQDLGANGSTSSLGSSSSGDTSARSLNSSRLKGAMLFMRGKSGEHAGSGRSHSGRGAGGSKPSHPHNDSTRKISRLGSVNNEREQASRLGSVTEIDRESVADELYRDSELAKLTTHSPCGRRRVLLPFEDPHHHHNADINVPAGLIAQLRNRNYDQSVELPSENMSRQSFYEHQAPGHDTVQFDSVEVIAYEYEEFVTLVIERIGTGADELQIRCTSKDINLKKQYCGFDSVVVLKRGQFEVTLDIPIQSNPRWSVEGMMTVTLEVEKGAASVGDIGTVIIVVLNEDRFPEGLPEHVTTRQLINGFFAHMIKSFPSEVWWGLVYKMVPGLMQFANQVIMWLVVNLLVECPRGSSDLWLLGDEDFDDDDSEKECPEYVRRWGLFPSGALLAYASMVLVTFICDFLCQRNFHALRLQGKATKALRIDIFTTVLQFSPKAQETFDMGRVMKIVERQAESSCACFIKIFTLADHVFQIVCMVVFAIWLGTAAPNAIWLVFVLPCVAFFSWIVFRCTRKRIIRMMSNANEADDGWTAYMAERLSIRPMVVNFNQEHVEAFEFTDILQKSNAAGFAAKQYMHLVVAGYCKFISRLTHAGIIIFSGLAVLNRAVNLGEFTALISISHIFGTTISEIYDEVFEIERGSDSIRRVAALLNAETRRHQLRRGQERRNRLLRTYRSRPDMPWEYESILCYCLSYKHAATTFSQAPLSCMIEPGAVVALTGRGGSGKTTLLRLIARHFIPSTGFVAYPESWRVRFLDGMNPPFFFRGTLLENLRFGNSVSESMPPHEDDEILALCRLFGVSETLLENPHAVIPLYGSTLSLTDATLLSIVRCMLSSVDVLLISNALDSLGEKNAVKVLNVLKDFVTHGFLEVLATQNLHMSGSGAPKTVIISSKLPMLEALCDHRLDTNPPDARGNEYGAVDGLTFGKLSPGGKSEWAYHMSQRKQDIIALYQEKNPAMLPEVDTLCATFGEACLLGMMKEKYLSTKSDDSTEGPGSGRHLVREDFTAGI